MIIINVQHNKNVISLMEQQLSIHQVDNIIYV